ncbi:D(1C) dopamine receptor-like [Hydractinia symbiolongicarpus]|uniref:D(1C) dopamine receptor-like n=1 Tax=Hydractinia symbiolongicarpus TaxID=13093 RepID=UPI00254C6A58|nr:D(1C) dopamine receptor-like [Hydractinia symbiolongicarpus]
MADGFAILITLSVALLFTLFNISTIVIVLSDRNLRRKSSNYPILSFLLVSAIQGFTAAPIYVYKKLDEENLGDWICDASRVPYFFCGHVMKISLLVISFDRMLAIRHPFHYEKHINKRNTLISLAILWLVTLAVDMVPFATDVNTESHCKYIPTRSWGLCVIIFYNIIPFILMANNYGLVWLVAAKVAIKDRVREESLMQSQRHDMNEKQFNNKSNRRKNQSQINRTSNIKFALEMKATKTSLTLIAVYVFCWGPLGVFYMIDHFCYNCLSDDRLSATRTSIKLLCFSSSLLAPIVYCWANNGYRKAAKRVCTKCFFKDKNHFNSSFGTSTELTHMKKEDRG